MSILFTDYIYFYTRMLLFNFAELAEHDKSVPSKYKCIRSYWYTVYEYRYTVSCTIRTARLVVTYTICGLRRPCYFLLLALVK